MNEDLCTRIILSLLLLGICNYIIKHKPDLLLNKHIRIIRKTASECTLFLKKNNEFPINKPGKVLLIGSGARNTVKGGYGSADVESKYYITCEKGLENAGFKITTKDWLYEYPLIKETKIHEHLEYVNYLHTNNNATSTYTMITFPEYEYELTTSKKEEEADIAIYVLARNSGEGMDRRLIKGDVLLTNTEIHDILYLNKHFKKFMLVLNVGGVVDLSPVQEVSNILLLSQLGVVTGDILADIILGKTNPSGKLATTWASINDYKFINDFGRGNKTEYKEGVYVGYRYFDTDGVEPLYPFGFGLSYTTFSISKLSLSNIKDEIEIKLIVENIGYFPGKEVVQVYISPSQMNMDKPYQSLISFKKTPLLNPFESVIMDIKFNLRDVARYDEEKACYILDKGDYIIRVGNSSRNTTIFGYISLKKNIKTVQLRNILGEPGFEDYKPKINITEDLSDIQNIEIKPKDIDLKIVEYNYSENIYDKITDLNDEELAYMCIGGFVENSRENNEKQRGINGLTTKKIKAIKHYLKMTDGPCGLRLAKSYFINSTKFQRLSPALSSLHQFKNLINQTKISLSINETEEDYSKYKNVIHQYTTNIPITTAYAQSFNVELVEKYGKIIGKEMEVYDIDLLLAPSINIHRNILCGRNFEYYSEDPLLTGKLASGFIRGVQSYKNKGTTVKHFAGYNQEYNRLNSNSKISERALREIYLKAFQITIEEAHPIALMTSYNLINRVHPSQNRQLLIDILRSEWNFNGLIMTDWIKSGQVEYRTSTTSPQYINDIIKAGNNIMMPGSLDDYNLILKYLHEDDLTREDLYQCASKVYEIIELLHK